MKMMRLPEVMAKTGLSRTRLYAASQEGTFPKPCKIGERATAWVESEVDAWIEQRIKSRDQGVSK